MNTLRTFPGTNPHAGIVSVLLFAGALLFQGCLAEPASGDSPEPMPNAGNTNLVVRLNVQNNAGEPLESLMFRFTSNLSDTLISSMAIATLSPDSARIIEKGFTFAPLRWWNLQVLAFDGAGVIRAQGNAGPFAAKDGIGHDSLVVNLGSFQELLVEAATDLR